MPAYLYVYSLMQMDRSAQFLITSVTKPLYINKKTVFEERNQCLTFHRKNNFHQSSDLIETSASLRFLERKKSVGKTWNSQMSPKFIPN